MDMNESELKQAQSQFVKQLLTTSINFQLNDVNQAIERLSFGEPVCFDLLKDDRAQIQVTVTEISEQNETVFSKIESTSLNSQYNAQSSINDIKELIEQNTLLDKDLHLNELSLNDIYSENKTTQIDCNQDHSFKSQKQYVADAYVDIGIKPTSTLLTGSVRKSQVLVEHINQNNVQIKLFDSPKCRKSCQQIQGSCYKSRLSHQ
ncbi:hypothetical protein SS50377_23693 [Spironucleus salmonicida]|uniref:Uncharacterized protein n=1 Tax=Spironucleus salmonicida TaxID=348837 RepID=V6LVT5_9EUKA|nr:hypothetical protein SS50377_23693 [Spironucleus salmonicida]|eukprot:EST48675.1 Hypothetical protein SS50377_11288 [Spironucleus salmonicida]